MLQGRAASSAWWVVVGSVLGLMVGNGPVFQFTFGLFIAPLVEEFGWSRGTISMGLTAGGLLGAAASPFVGIAIDRWGVRRVTLVFIVLFSLGMASIALATTAATFVLLYGLAGLLSAGQAPLPYARAISTHFDGKRGLALGLAMAGVGLGAAIVPQVTRLFIETWGWRGAYVALGVLTCAIALPAVAFLVDDNRIKQSLLEQPGRTVREAFTDRRFWYIAAVIFLVAAATNGTIAHAIPLLTDRGISTQVATSVLAVIGIALIAGRLLAGYLLDRVFAPYIAFAFFAIPIVGIAILKVSSETSGALTGIFLIGLGLGAEVDLIAFLLSRYFGLKSFGKLYGCLFMLFSVGTGVGPLVMGRSYDLTGSYNMATSIFCGGLIVSALLMLLLGPYTYPVIKSRGLPVENQAGHGVAQVSEPAS